MKCSVTSSERMIEFSGWGKPEWNKNDRLENYELEGWRVDIVSMREHDKLAVERVCAVVKERLGAGNALSKLRLSFMSGSTLSLVLKRLMGACTNSLIITACEGAVNPNTVADFIGHSVGLEELILGPWSMPGMTDTELTMAISEHQSLRHMWFPLQGGGRRGNEQLGSIVEWGSLEKLTLDSSTLSLSIARVLRDGLRGNETLRQLVFSGQIDFTMSHAVAKALREALLDDSSLSNIADSNHTLGTIRGMIMYDIWGDHGPEQSLLETMAGFNKRHVDEHTTRHQVIKDKIFATGDFTGEDLLMKWLLELNRSEKKRQPSEKGRKREAYLCGAVLHWLANCNGSERTMYDQEKMSLWYVMRFLQVEPTKVIKKRASV